MLDRHGSTVVLIMYLFTRPFYHDWLNSDFKYSDHNWGTHDSRRIRHRGSLRLLTPSYAIYSALSMIGLIL